jgi:hypothetical protein
MHSSIPSLEAKQIKNKYILNLVLVYQKNSRRGE